MSIVSFEVVVAKEYETRVNGRPITKTAWNRVGRAWRSRDSESLNFELFLIPNQRYVIPLREPRGPEETLKETIQSEGGTL